MKSSLTCHGYFWWKSWSIKNWRKWSDIFDIKSISYRIWVEYELNLKYIVYKNFRVSCVICWLKDIWGKKIWQLFGFVFNIQKDYIKVTRQEACLFPLNHMYYPTKSDAEQRTLEWRMTATSGYGKQINSYDQ